MRALVIDDSRTMRMILKKTLTTCGFSEFSEAGDGVEALAVLGERADFELALVDWNMPRMNGYQLVQAVRANPAWNDIKIVMVTTEADLTNVQQALEAGANEYVMKPFTPDMIAEKLEMIGVTG